MLWIIFRFVLIGPVVGTLGFVLVDQIFQVMSLSPSTLAQTSSFAELPLAVAVLSLYGLLLAYPLGTVPAALAGAAFARIVSRQSAVPSLAVRASLSAALGAILAVSLGLVFTTGQFNASLFCWLVAGAAGGAASGLSASRVLVTRAQRAFQASGAA